MNKCINWNLREKILERDKFTCQKCKLGDELGTKLEVHHITPLYSDGKDDLDNLITLCLDCHHYAPNNKEEFEEYMKDEMDGTLTTLVKAWSKVRREHPELFKES